jgi:hypothetical protein
MEKTWGPERSNGLLGFDEELHKKLALTMIPRLTRRRIVYARLCAPPQTVLTLLTGLILLALD